MALTRISGNNLILYLGSNENKSQPFELPDGSFQFSGLDTERLPIAYSDNLSVTLDKQVIDTNNKSELGFRSIVPVVNSMSVNTSAFLIEQSFEDLLITDHELNHLTLSLPSDGLTGRRNLRLDAIDEPYARMAVSLLVKEFPLVLGCLAFDKDVGEPRLFSIQAFKTTKQAVANGRFVETTVDRDVNETYLRRNILPDLYDKVQIRAYDGTGTKFDTLKFTPAELNLLSKSRTQQDLDRYWSGDLPIYFEFGLGYDRWQGHGYVTNYNIATAANDVAKVTLDIEANERFQLVNVSPFAVQLAFDASEFDAAVAAWNRGDRKTYYRGTTLKEYRETGNKLYAESSKKLLAPAGFYADASNVRKWSGTAWTGANKTR